MLRVGCAMWAHPPWVGRFLSPGLKGRELSEYARWCNAVEGNTTFYGVPSASTVARWADLAPSSFRFAFKVPKTITHERRLMGDAGVLLASFLDAMTPLHDRFGPVQLQLPPSFGPESMGALARFVGTLPGEFDWMVELRHAAFFDGGAAHRAVDDVLGSAGVGRVVLDTRPLYATPPHTVEAVSERAQKPPLPVTTEGVGDTPIVRLIGGDDDEVTIAGLREWVPTVVRWLAAGHEPFVFVHQPDNHRSPELARLFHAMVAEQLRDLPPLPEPIPVAPATEVPGQSTLF